VGARTAVVPKRVSFLLLHHRDDPHRHVRMMPPLETARCIDDGGGAPSELGERDVGRGARVRATCVSLDLAGTRGSFARSTSGEGDGEPDRRQHFWSNVLSPALRAPSMD